MGPLMANAMAKNYKTSYIKLFISFRNKYHLFAFHLKMMTWSHRNVVLNSFRYIFIIRCLSKSNLIRKYSKINKQLLSTLDAVIFVSPIDCRSRSRCVLLHFVE